jgi:MFS family permease
LLAVTTIEDWRSFSAPRFRTYHALALTQGVVGVLAGFDVVIPFALAIGCPPFIAVLLGVLPLAGGMGQLIVPRLLDRTNGNLRGLTLFFAGISEPRGLYLAALAALVTFGIVTGPLAVLVLSLILAVTTFLTSIVGANLLSWHSAVLPEQDRRLVVPRLLAVSLAIGALLLIPIAAALDALYHHIGPLAYALPFAISGVLGIAEIYVLRQLRHPGRFIVPPEAETSDALPTPELKRFLEVSSTNAFGMGFAPSMSVFAIAVVGVTAGFAIMISSIGTLTMVVAAAVAGSRLARGSSTTMLRQSFFIRALAMAAPLLALPGTALAPVFLIASSMLGAVGFAFGSLAANEKLFRLISGPAVVRQHARYLFRTSGAMTAAQFMSAGVVAIAGPIGFPAFAFLYAGSSVLRVSAWRAAGAPAGAQRPLAVTDAGASVTV